MSIERELLGEGLEIVAQLSQIPTLAPELKSVPEVRVLLATAQTWGERVLKQVGAPDDRQELIDLLRVLVYGADAPAPEDAAFRADALIRAHDAKSGNA